MSLFGIDIAGIVAQSLGAGLPSTTLTKVTPGAYNPADPLAGNNSTTTTYTAKAAATKWLEEFDDKSGLTRTIYFELTVLLGTMSTPGIVPEEGDKLTAQRPNTTTTYNGTITKMKIDAAGAAAVCSCEAGA